MSNLVSASLVIGLGAGCIDLTGPETETGTYYLASVDGKPPRVTISEDGTERMEIVNGSLTLEREGSISYTLAGESTDKSDHTIEQVSAGVSGRYIRDGSSIIATFEEGYQIDMTYASNYREARITFTEPEGAAMVFKKVNRGGEGIPAGVRG